MRGAWLCTFVFLLPVAAAAVEDDDPDVEIARRHLDSGWKFYDAKSWGKALEEFEAAQLVRPQLGLKQNIANCLDKLGRYKAALDTYQQYLDESPEGAGVAAARARVEELKALVAKGITEAPPIVENKRFDKGRKLYESHDYAHALVEFEAARKSRPPPPGIDYNIARCLDRLERYKEAIASYERYLGAKPDPFESEEAVKRVQTLKARLAVMEEKTRPPLSQKAEKKREVEKAAEMSDPSGPMQPRRTDLHSPPPVEEKKPQPEAPPAAETPPPEVVVPPPLPPQPEPPPQPFFRAHLIPLSVGAGAVVLLVTGAALAGSVGPAFNDLKNTCAPGCDPASWQSLKTRANAGYALLAIGAAAALADAGLWIWELKFHKPDRRAWLAPTVGGLVAGGNF